ncbi:DnaD domain protein [Ureibacillus sp. Re31]|uniref:DnaD domain protein n=1 Tax=Ureibacillus galli TaxID=2762222 RepID=A0ABR8XAU1_9BACL|nr:DnaD domain protein [Ureibacillus galli]MBD8026449.1 DnaD domain protein [Ureibacillus galli]
MAKYRQVHTTFWDDGFVLDLTPEEKYFYLYLMTNNNTTQCGIYELPYRVIEMQTGYNRDTVVKLLGRFIEYGKVLYNESTKEIMLVNWAKYNFINSPKVKKCIEKELRQVKHIPFINSYLTSLEQYGYHIDTVSIPLNHKGEPKDLNPNNDKGSIPYQYPMDSPCIDLGEEQEQEKEQEEEKEKEQQQKSPLSSTPSQKLFDLFTKRLNKLPSAQLREDINYYLETYKDVDLIVEAFNRALLDGKVKAKERYANGILRNWKREGITSYKLLEDKKIQEQHQFKSKPFKKEVIPEWFNKRDQPNSQSDEVIDFEAERQKILAKLEG